MGRSQNRYNKRWNESAFYNAVAYQYYYERFRELAISNFKYTDMPDSCDVRFLETALFEKGVGVIFRDDVTEDLLSLYAMGSSRLNIYGNWSTYYGYAANTYKSRELSPDSGVLIYNNMNHLPDARVARMFARRLYDLDRTIDINIKNTRQPKLVLCDEKQRLSMENLLMQYDGGFNNIFADSALNLEQIKVLDLQAPYLCDKIQQLKTEIWNEALTFLGISNSVVNKRERLISDEVLSNQGGIFASRNGRLYERQKAIDRVNELFGTDIKVDFNDAALSELQATEEAAEEPEEVDIDE